MRICVWQIKQTPYMPLPPACQSAGQTSKVGSWYDDGSPAGWSVVKEANPLIWSTGYCAYWAEHPWPHDMEATGSPSVFDTTKSAAAACIL